MKERIRASVGILTLNNRETLPRALESLKDFEDVFICDGNSTDGTQDIARSFGVRVVKQVESDEPHQKITDFGTVRTKCIEASLLPWHLRVDSDEYISPQLAEEIRRVTNEEHSTTLVYKVPRKYILNGRVIDDTITYPNYQIRLFRRDAVEGYTKMTHERLVPKHGQRVEKLCSDALMYVPLPEYGDLDTRMTRALDWDRRHYEANITFTSWVHAVVHTIVLLTLYSIRLVRVRLISRGTKVPLSYELWRFKYQLRTLLLATHVFFRKLIG